MGGRGASTLGCLAALLAPYRPPRRRKGKVAVGGWASSGYARRSRLAIQPKVLARDPCQYFNRLLASGLDLDNIVRRAFALTRGSDADETRFAPEFLEGVRTEITHAALDAAG